ncbi:hypothetical protein BC938DRAFT_476373 [Jimgerdemannia flammicorona]|uniref:Uncharacterized protein n=1 Tax=Jimgerdemannia flammicorona TaxID=994334 RepID=A0A433PHM3_9FUNG|nr:hypothetical protein BC938DRAFT_476373 [Jimgerdemannia flammicorona]
MAAWAQPWERVCVPHSFTRTKTNKHPLRRRLAALLLLSAPTPPHVWSVRTCPIFLPAGEPVRSTPIVQETSGHRKGSVLPALHSGSAWNLRPQSHHCRRFRNMSADVLTHTPQTSHLSIPLSLSFFVLSPYFSVLSLPNREFAEGPPQTTRNRAPQPRIPASHGSSATGWSRLHVAGSMGLFSKPTVSCLSRTTAVYLI